MIFAVLFTCVKRDEFFCRKYFYKDSFATFKMLEMNSYHLNENNLYTIA